ncbi:hypothetical protein Tco_1201237 [Tanacetum coccineum]
MLLYIKGKESRKLLVDSVLNGPFKYGTVTVPRTQTTPATVRDRTYDELTDAKKLHESCDIKATNIERESKLYDEFDMFTSVPGETIHSYYLRQHKAHADEVHIMKKRFPNPLALVANTYNSSPSYSNQTQYHQQLSPFASQQQVSRLASQQFSSLNKEMAFISTAFTSQHPLINNQLRTSSILMNQKTIQYGRVTMHTLQGRQNQGYASSRARSNATGVNKNRGTNTVEAFQTYDLDAFDSDCDEAPSASVVLMAKLYSYDSKILLEVPIHDNYLDNHVIDQNVQEMQYSEQPVFNNDTNTKITSDSNMISYEQYLKETENTVVQDTSSSAQQEAIIMSVIEERNNQVSKCNKVDKENKMINESLTAELERYKEQIKLFEERHKFDLNDKEKYIDSQLRKVIVDKNTKVADFENHIHSLKQQLNATVESHKTLSTTVDVLKKESKGKEDKYLEEIIDLEKKNKALDNVVYKMGQSTQTMHMLTKPQAFYDESHKTLLGYQNPLYLTQVQRKVHVLYCGNIIVKQHDALSVIDTKETLELAEESRLKMHAKQNNPIMKEKKVNVAPIDYVALNKLSMHFVPQKQLSTEQAFWLPISKPVSEIPSVQPEPVLKEIHLELPTISLVKDSFNKMINHVNDFKNVVTVRTKVTGQNEGIHKKITDMKEVFTQMETEAAKCFVERKSFKIKEKALLLENDRLLDLIISQDLVHTAVNSLAEIIDYQSMKNNFLDEYSECVELKAELSKKNDMVEKAVSDELSK